VEVASGKRLVAYGQRGGGFGLLRLNCPQISQGGSQ